MTRVHYPAILFGPRPDEPGWGVIVPGINVNAQGDTPEAALIEASEGVQEVIDHHLGKGEPVPGPGVLSDYDDIEGGEAAVIQATLPAQAA